MSASTGRPLARKLPVTEHVRSADEGLSLRTVNEHRPACRGISAILASSTSVIKCHDLLIAAVCEISPRRVLYALSS